MGGGRPSNLLLLELLRGFFVLYFGENARQGGVGWVGFRGLREFGFFLKG